MGESQSTSRSSHTTFDPDYYADWSGKAECSHSRSSYRVTEIRWIKVPFTDPALKGTTEAGIWTARILSFGIADAAMNLRKSDLSHECLEILYKCRICDCTGRFTAEIISDGYKQFRSGCYNKELSLRKSYSPSNMTVAYVERKHDEMGTSYDFVNNNCFHWSGRLWDKL